MENTKSTTAVATATTARKPDGAFTMKMGNTTYNIGLHFKQDSKESIEDKVKRLIEQDIKTGNF